MKIIEDSSGQCHYIDPEKTISIKEIYFKIFIVYRDMHDIIRCCILTKKYETDKSPK